jgi:superfamily II DNA or RNA helicase
MKEEALGTNRFVREYDLDVARRYANSARSPQAHQEQGLRKIHEWFEKPSTDMGRGALLVLPTGGGKTFTAVRFLCEWPLSAGYKVLWLAHTHHLLEQAFDTFGPSTYSQDAKVEVSKIREPREKLRVRVVSGMPGHAKVASISPSDDVVIGSLQTIAGAHRDDHESLLTFLRSAGEKLVVVFDEAHHAPAPTYARFVEALRVKVPTVHLLGLTATPVYEAKLRKGWLKKLFPQGIAYQTSANTLMAAKVLARPIVKQCATHIAAEVDERRLARWRESYSDLPEDIVTGLAENQARNDVIVQHYAENRAKYGKTLIFADRWSQCDYLATSLRKHGIRADVVYSKVDAKGQTIDERNRRTADDNTKAIRAFKSGEIEVLVNVRMLTEGTDVPSIQSVFLTRQTTSKVLLTQMVGRALRGTASGGTEHAYIVSFIDDWKQRVNWAEFNLDDGATADDDSEARARLPIQLISIELVRRLAREMYEPSTGRGVPFLETLPVGWYRTEFDTLVKDTEDEVVHLTCPVLVYDRDQAGFQRLLDRLAKEDLSAFIEPSVSLDRTRDRIDAWAASCFPDNTQGMGTDLATEIFHLARHVAQAEDNPRFIPFEGRSAHDLDLLAKDAVARNVGLRDIPLIVHAEYRRQDRLWPALYGSVELFRRQFSLAVERASAEAEAPGPHLGARLATEPERYEAREPPQEMKHNVKERDGWKCLCCGAADKKFLEVDHIVPVHQGGKNEMENLQTLCKPCNGDKGVNRYSFRRVATGLQQAHHEFEPRRLPRQPGDREQWERCVRATLNHYFRCSAVSRVDIGGRGVRFYEWLIKLNAHNDPRLLEGHLASLLARIQEKRSQGNFAGPDAIVVEGSDARGDAWSTSVRTGKPALSQPRTV